MAAGNLHAANARFRKTTQCDEPNKIRNQCFSIGGEQQPRPRRSLLPSSPQLRPKSTLPTNEDGSGSFPGLRCNLLSIHHVLKGTLGTLWTPESRHSEESTSQVTRGQKEIASSSNIR
ncbi:hypothetical protein JDV02_007834 [Purpureocillium takamizusanense]|uniref:Uncharacterized protein n=1 Tax=Purpureocillium takamizusanense TaxID=2060973 RepID=A0A9Q8VEJ4_9HYPO|nr:uncharacterized protein JDV02_007834 [Purpureocillium takamizusanense]UNI21887.1 hypothetical protein JDV02_007834 [Purpureocillium takamizusanense]